MRKIPRTMSTQHPDNVSIPFFAQNAVLGGDDEVTEAYFVFSHLGCDEQMWDYEGKEVDAFVVRKLLTKYESFFRMCKLGVDVFLTPRVPNPSVEKNEGKVLLETLESIPRSYDIAHRFYGEDVPPIFEVILPMTTSHVELNRVYFYYKKYVAGKQHMRFFDGDITISEWVGKFKPEEIHVIPLIEDMKSMLSAHRIVEEYLKDKDFEYIRVFLARSDPALNYGVASAVLLNKIALQRLYHLSEKISVDIFPIVGVGSAPFRGNFKPSTVDLCLKNYPDVQTFTVQSAFKYDYPTHDVIKALEKVNHSKRGRPILVDEERALEIIRRFSEEYSRQVELLANLINMIAKYVPDRRKRKLHIGLFGYSRKVGNVKLPRAIRFCASLYSIGLPPELLGLNVLTEKDLDFICDAAPSFLRDLADGLQYFNEKVLDLIPVEVAKRLRLDIIDFEINEEHLVASTNVINAIKRGDFTNLSEQIVHAAKIRSFLG
ncbi:MAG: phosphoenolpyruvate carboxylase [Candidatus Baldrarchaeia archaeon]